MNVSAKKVVVLGASAEGGTGWRVAESLAGEGMQVIAGARSLEGIQKLAAKIGCHAIRCDATIEREVSAMADAAVEAGGGPLDAAVLIAGEGVTGSIDTIDESELLRAMTLNYLAPVYFVRHMARRMRPGGCLVLMSSIVATRAWQGYFAYGCAKAALETLVKYAALEYASQGIRVNAVAPGPIQTPASAAFLTNPAIQEVLANEIPLQHPALPEQVAEVIRWLVASAPHITGECFAVDGGMHLLRPPHPREIGKALGSV